MAAHPTVALLDPLLGRWRTTGEELGADGTTVVRRFAGTDVYRRLGDAVVVHEIDVTMGDEVVRGVEIVGPWDPGLRAFRTVAHGGDGSEDRATATADPDGGWTFRSGTGPERAEARLHAEPGGRRLVGAWSRTTDDGATWTPWMRLVLDRDDGD